MADQQQQQPAEPKRITKFDQENLDRLEADLAKFYSLRAKIRRLKEELREAEEASDRKLARNPALANVVGFARKRARVTVEGEPEAPREEPPAEGKGKKRADAPETRSSSSRAQLEKKLRREAGVVSGEAREELRKQIKGQKSGTAMELE